ncbi:hypothetical protein TCAL_16463, partial [Tigriopus californicus]
MKTRCGRICVTEKSATEVIGQGWYDIIRKPFTCKNMFKSDLFDGYSGFEEPPHRFTYQGRVPVVRNYINGQIKSSKNIICRKETVNHFIRNTLEGRPTTSYGQNGLAIYNIALNQTQINGTHVLVIGSRNPWEESIMLGLGAAHVSTVEYSTIECNHPQITTYTPPELDDAFLDGTLPVFDGVVSFSSIEHSGLGRYGDALNPYGDLIAMARAWCLVKDLGFALVGVPTGPDHIIFNVHQVYGPLMYSHLFANWQQVYTNTDMSLFTSEGHRRNVRKGGYLQTVHLLRKNIALYNL